MQNIEHYIDASNVFTLRVEVFVYMFDTRWGAVIKALAEGIHSVLEPDKELVLLYEMVKRQIGKDFGMQDYVD